MTFITHGFRVSVVSDVRERIRNLVSPLRFMLRRSSLVECVSVLHGTCLQSAEWVWNILVNKRLYKDFFKIYFYAKIKTIVYYHLRQCLCESVYPHKANNIILFRFRRFPESQYSVKNSVFFLGRHYHRICHQLNIYGMNSVDMFSLVKIHRKHYRSCVTHLCTSGTTFHKPLSNDWLVLWRRRCEAVDAARGGHTRYWTPETCMAISVCPWFVLIMMLRNLVDIALFAMPIWI